MKKKRVVIIDDHPIVRQGYAQLINREFDLETVGEAEDSSSALRVIEELKPDIALIDLSLKDSNGLELIKNLAVSHKDLKILVISLHDENVYAERALRAGAKGYIMKSEATKNVMTAIRSVIEGNIYLSPNMRSRIIEHYADGGIKDGNAVDVLSDREFEVFQLIGKGVQTSKIAEQLNLSVKTIETYKSHIKTKLGLDSGTELMQRAVEWELSQS
ncbi:MAG: response regulator transcription factor [Spirochaetaceae bacterium]